MKDDFRKIQESSRSSKQTAAVMEIDRTRAQRLRRLARELDLKVSRNKKYWSHSFAILRRRVSDAKVIDDILDYVIGCKVKVKHGREFLRRFHHFAKLAGRDDYKLSRVVVDSQTKFVADRIKMMGWPPAVRYLPQLVQLSMDVVRQLYARLQAKTEEYGKAIPIKYDQKIHKQPKYTKSAIKAIKRGNVVKQHPKWAKTKVALDNLPHYPENFVEFFYKWMNAKMLKWPEFASTFRLEQLIFKPDEGFGLRFGQNFLHWDYILEETKDE